MRPVTRQGGDVVAVFLSGGWAGRERWDGDEGCATGIAGPRVGRVQCCWARHQSITDPEHAAAARRLRAELWQQQDVRAHAARAALLAPDSLGIEVEQRELGTYDRMFTLIEGGAGKEDT
ncbi:hypothetical protein ABZ468_51765 [Streptomyces sp. NPDC005708]|uniref:hypothetical protein n=1 Tax=Streptomyces sp. NPDC005708 TaxID=3154564 RepID=UPI0033F48B18